MDDEVLSRLHVVTVQLHAAIARVEDYNEKWWQIIDNLDGEAKEAEEAVYANFLLCPLTNLALEDEGPLANRPFLEQCEVAYDTLVAASSTIDEHAFSRADSRQSGASRCETQPPAVGQSSSPLMDRASRCETQPPAVKQSSSPLIDSASRAETQPPAVGQPSSPLIDMPADAETQPPAVDQSQSPLIDSARRCETQPPAVGQPSSPLIDSASRCETQPSASLGDETTRLRQMEMVDGMLAKTHAEENNSKSQGRECRNKGRSGDHIASFDLRHVALAGERGRVRRAEERVAPENEEGTRRGLQAVVATETTLDRAKNTKKALLDEAKRRERSRRQPREELANQSWRPANSCRRPSTTTTTTTETTAVISEVPSSLQRFMALMVLENRQHERNVKEECRRHEQEMERLLVPYGQEGLGEELRTTAQGILAGRRECRESRDDFFPFPSPNFVHFVSPYQNSPNFRVPETKLNQNLGFRVGWNLASQLNQNLLFWKPAGPELGFPEKRGGCQPQQQNGVGETVNEKGVRANIADDGEQSRVVEDEEVVEPQKHPLPADAGVVAAVPEPAHGNNGEEEQYEIEKIYAVYTHNGNGNNNNTTHGVLTT
ncbi:hypothetical protein GPALN_005977 [Globodera pallida]|nr:hypothetical protein GPALN_005977 [Globodera pallida]